MIKKLSDLLGVSIATLRRIGTNESVFLDIGSTGYEMTRYLTGYFSDRHRYDMSEGKSIKNMSTPE